MAQFFRGKEDCHPEIEQAEKSWPNETGAPIPENQIELAQRRWTEAEKALRAYFTRLASSHRMAARSNSVNEVTPNFSLARAQYA